MVGDGRFRSLSGGSLMARLFHFSLFGNACASLHSIITEAADTAAAGQALG